MHSVGVNTAEMRTIKRVLSAILHLGNVSFKDNGEGHLATVDGDKSRQHMNWACELLGVDNVRYCLNLRNHVLSLEVVVRFVLFDLLKRALQVQFETWMCSWKIGTMVVPRPHSEVLFNRHNMH